MALIAVSFAWVLGVYLGSVFHFPLAAVAIGLLPVPFIVLFKKHRKTFIILAVCLAALFGAIVYYPFSLPQADRISIFNNRDPVILEGLVAAPPDISENTTHIEIAVSKIDGESISGTVLVFVPHYPEYRYGDKLSLKGRLTDPPRFSDFDYQAYLARQDIYSTMFSPSIQVLSRSNGNILLEWVYNLRGNLSDSLARALPEPQASLAQGILLGIRSSIPDDLRNDLSITGSAHLLAVSGINLTIISGILVSLGLWIFGRRHYIYVWLALLMVWFYALITGLQAPVVRAAIMASIFLFAELLGRQKNGLVALVFSAGIMVGLESRLLWSVSFQLTFLSMAGLAFIAPFLKDRVRGGVYAVLGQDRFGVGLLTMVTDSLCITLGAIIAIWPVIAYNFGIVSFVGPLSTFLIAPVFPYIIIASSLTSLIGLVSPPVSQWAGWIAWLPLSYMLWLVNIFAVLPAAYIRLNAIPGIFLWVYYSILGLAVCINSNLKKILRLLPGITKLAKPVLDSWLEAFTSAPKKFIIVPLLVVAILTSVGAATMPDKDLHVSFLDVGEGAAVLVQIDNQSILIDGGPGPGSVVRGISDKLPFWDRTIDLVILTHPHQDHLGGLVEVLQRYEVKQVLAPGLASDSALFREWMNLIGSKNILYTTALAGQHLALNDGAEIEILNPLEINPGVSEDDIENEGIVARLSFDQVSFLFTGDIEKECEAELISRHADLSSTVLQVAHHGSTTSTTPGFLLTVQPQIAVIPVGADNNYGHPAKQVLDRLSTRTVYRTDLCGAIEFTTDGQNLWVKTDE